MEKHLFYVPQLTYPEQFLPEEESRHCIKALRMKKGDRVLVTDGKGKIFFGSLLSEDPRGVLVSLDEEFEGRPPRDYRVHIGLAPTKNISRFEWFLEKCTEIGIDEITPLICENSERKVIKPARLEKVIIAAAKQSLTGKFPLLHEEKDFSEAVRFPGNLERYIGYLDQDSIALKAKYTPGSDVLILIGPEGDFTPEEVADASVNGFIPVTLGPARLRTETAGIVACHTINLLNEL